MNNFEINGDYRLMDNAQLVYILTNSENMVYKVKERETVYGESPDLESVLEKMTPGRRKLAQASIELYKRVCSSREDRPKISGSRQVFEIMQPVIGDIQNEECWVIFLDQSAKIIRKLRIASGGYTSTIVDTRIILKEALLSKAVSYILCHNHPSGNFSPSRDDDRLTQSLKQAAELMNIRMLDHIIITNKSYYSYADEGKI